MSRMKSRAYVALAALLALSSASCDSFLDVNENPNRSESAPVTIQLPAVLGLFSNAVLGSWPSKMSAEWTQQLSFNREPRGFARYDQYEMRAIDSDQLWDAIFTGVLNETQNLIRQAGEDDAWAYSATGKTMQAWTYAVATDVWGPIPFSQALDPRIRKPEYDDQKTVYEGVQLLLDEALVEFERPNFPNRMPGNNDLLYGGDLNRWIKLANHLKAQFHLRVSGAAGENRTQHAQAALDALAKGLASNLDDADFRYPGGTIGRQPWHVARTVAGYRMSHHYVELLRSRTDPRLAITAERTAAEPTVVTYRGHVNSAPQEADARFSRVNNLFVLDTASFTWASYANAKFLEAEAQLIVSGAAAADAAYRAGIRANMEKMRVAASAITTYINARPNLSTVANPLEEIMREKYIANFLKFEAWNDWRRTGFPRLTPVADALTNGIPQRFPTPGSELNINAENASALPAGLQGMSVKLWWAGGT